MSVMQNLDMERQSSWNETERLILEVGQVHGLWNTSDSWFTQCRSMVQVEFAGKCFNSIPSRNLKDPHFAQLFMFPVKEDEVKEGRLESYDNNKLFITVFVVEGKSEIPDQNQFEQSKGAENENDNIYKRIAEYCLDIGEICNDQLVHELTLTLPVHDKCPQPSALFNPLRNCDISGFFNENLSMMDSSNLLEGITPEGGC